MSIYSSGSLSATAELRPDGPRRFGSRTPTYGSPGSVGGTVALVADNQGRVGLKMGLKNWRRRVRSEVRARTVVHQQYRGSLATTARSRFSIRFAFYSSGLLRFRGRVAVPRLPDRHRRFVALTE